MQDRTGELCPSCKKGKLRPTGNREVKEPDKSPSSGEARREFTEYECDTCKHRCKAHALTVVETMGFNDKVNDDIKKKGSK
jgi:hypothetical protein